MQKNKNKFGPECWEEPWATFACSDGTAQDWNTDPLLPGHFRDCVYVRANNLDTCYKSNGIHQTTVPLCNVACVSCNPAMGALHHLHWDLVSMRNQHEHHADPLAMAFARSNKVICQTQESFASTMKQGGFLIF